MEEGGEVKKGPFEGDPAFMLFFMFLFFFKKKVSFLLTMI